MLPRDADNIVAAGRCVDADVHALSAIRVMGPCIAMGAAAAHASTSRARVRFRTSISPRFRKGSRTISND